MNPMKGKYGPFVAFDTLYGSVHCMHTVLSRQELLAWAEASFQVSLKTRVHMGFSFCLAGNTRDIMNPIQGDKMFKLFKKKTYWRFIPASNVCFGDVVSEGLIVGEVLYSHTRTFEDSTLETFVINMPKKLFGTRIAEFTVPSDKPIKVAKK